MLTGESCLNVLYTFLRCLFLINDRLINFVLLQQRYLLQYIQFKFNGTCVLKMENPVYYPECSNNYVS